MKDILRGKKTKRKSLHLRAWETAIRSEGGKINDGLIPNCKAIQEIAPDSTAANIGRAGRLEIYMTKK